MAVKRVLVALICVLLIVSLCSCKYNVTENDHEGNDGRLVVVYADGFTQIHADTETGCQYISRANCGTCLMVDADGNPLLYDFGKG